MAGKRKAHLARKELQRGRPGLQLSATTGTRQEELALQQAGPRETFLMATGNFRIAGSGKQGRTGYFLPCTSLSSSVGRADLLFQFRSGAQELGAPPPWPTHLSWGVTSLGGFLRYCLKRNSKAWPMVLMTS